MIRRASVFPEVTRQRGPGVPALPKWLAPPPPPAVDAAVDVLCARRRDRSRTAVLVPDGEGSDVLGLSVAARLVCAHPRVRWRFRDRTWWLRIGDRASGEAATLAVLRRRDDALAGGPLGFPEGWSSERGRYLLRAYRRLLLVVDEVPPDAVEPHRLVSTERGHAGLLVSGPVPPGATPIAVPSAVLGEWCRRRLRDLPLPDGDRDRLNALAVVDGGTEVPIGLVEALWGTGPEETRSLLDRLARPGLLRVTSGSTVSVDPLVTAMGRESLGVEGFRDATAGLLDRIAAAVPAAAPLPGSSCDQAWWTATTDDGCLRDLLVRALLRAGRRERAAALTGDLRWIAHRVRHDGPAAALDDLAALTDDESGTRTRSFTSVARLLDPLDPVTAVDDVLIDELRHHPAWSAQAEALQEATARPVLRGHRPRLSEVRRPHVGSAVLAPDRRHLATAVGTTVTCTDLDGGTATTLSLSRDESVRQLCFGPAGDWVAVLSHNSRNGFGVEDPPYTTYLRVWEPATGTTRFRLSEGRHFRHFGSFTISPDGESLCLSANDGDHLLTTSTGGPHPGPHVPPDPVPDPLVSPGGTWRASIEADVVRLHDLRHDRPGPLTRTTGSRSDHVGGVLWITDHEFLVHGSNGWGRYRVVVDHDRDFR